MHLHTTLLGLVSEARPDKGGRRTDSCVSRVCVSLVLLAYMSTTATAVTDVVSTSTGHEAQAVDDTLSNVVGPQATNVWFLVRS